MTQTRLVGELDSTNISEDDITSLPVHHCYVRTTTKGQRMPAFSMQLRPPEVGNYAVAERIRQASDAYTTPAGVVDKLVERGLADELAGWRASLRSIPSHVSLSEQKHVPAGGAGPQNGFRATPCPEGRYPSPSEAPQPVP